MKHQTTPSALTAAIQARLSSRKAKGLLRLLHTPLPPAPPHRLPDAHPPLVNLTSNDFLGLSHHPEVIQAAQQAATTWGTGAGASRLISGTKQIHQDLEKLLAQFKGTQTTLLFPTGLQTNLGVLAALGTLPVSFFSDELNHASIVDGIRLTKRPKHIFAHRDLSHLEDSLKNKATSHTTPVVVTDSVFSTTGEKADLPALSQLCRHYQALLVVDEAHATGVLGPHGAGLCAEQGVQAPLQIATLSKALGASGGFVATSNLFYDLLLNEARSFIYTTALSPVMAAAAAKAAQIVQSPEGDRLRSNLHRNAETVASALRHQGWSVRHESHILAVLLGDPHLSLQAARALRTQGIFALPFRPPTVPPASSLLRLAPNALHDDQDMARVIAAFDAIRDQILPALPNKPQETHP